MTETPVKDPSSKLFPNFGVIISRVAIAVAMLPLALFAYSLLGRYFFFAELVSNFRVQIMMMLLPFALLTLSMRRWWLCGLIGFAVIWCMAGTVWIHLPSSQPPAGPKKLKIMSYNILGTNERQHIVIQKIKQIDPDVISVLEYTNFWHMAFDELGDTYPYRIRLPRWHGFGVAMLSKYPLENRKISQLTGHATDNPLIMADVKFAGQTIRIAAMHVISPMNRDRMDIRNSQLSEAADIFAGDGKPTVVMGDFNCTPWSPFLQDFLVKTGYRDSRQGFGYQGTWPAQHWPLRIPIDHAFVSEEIHVHSRTLGHSAGSDHIPIVFEVSTAKVPTVN